MPKQKSYDVFISHASEDKVSVADTIAAKLRERGFTVWYDEFTLKPGSSLSESIIKGIRESGFGLVILSPAFFRSKKKWTKYELRALRSEQFYSGKSIIPIWHNISASQVAKIDPVLADQYAISTSIGLGNVVDKIDRTIRVSRDLMANPVAQKLELPSLEVLGNSILELGIGFAYVVGNCKVSIGTIKDSIDLLFYHKSLKCFVAVDMYTSPLNPAMIGRILFHMGVIDRDFKNTREAPTLGIILCPKKHDELVTLARNYVERIFVSEYVLSDSTIRGRPTRLMRSKAKSRLRLSTRLRYASSR